MPVRISIRVKFFVLFLVISTLPMVLVGYMTGNGMGDRFLDSVGRNLKIYSQQQAQAIGDLLAVQIYSLQGLDSNDRIEEQVEVVNQSYEGKDAAAEIMALDQQWQAAADDDALIQERINHPLTRYLLEYQQRNPEHIEIFITDRYGGVVATTNRISDFNQSDEEWWQRTSRGQVFIGKPEFDESSQVLALVIAIPIENAQGVVGVLRTTYTLSKVVGLLEYQGGDRSTGHGDIYLPDGNVLTAKGQGLTLSTADPQTLAMVKGSVDKEYFPVEIDGETNYLAQSPVVTRIGDEAVNALGWIVVFSQPREVSLRPSREVMYTTLLTIGIVAALMLLLSLVMAQFLAKPTEMVTKAAHQVSEGNLDVHVVVKTNDEFQTLAEAFNNMAIRLKELIEAEREQRDHLQKTIVRYVESLTLIGNGNLTERVQLEKIGEGEADPLYVLGSNLNDMVDRLQGMIVRIRDAALNLATASNELLATTTQQVSGANEQSSGISEVTTTVEEVKTIADQVAQRALQVVGVAKRTQDISQSGKQAIETTMQSMTRIKMQVEGIAENILALSEQTQQIGEIITTVNEIAAQSNMLALNASVEAARAGEHGKGFAVVASEVRSLAEQSKQATVQVKEILSEIQRATNATVMATEEGTKGVEQGMQYVYRLQEALNQLTEVIRETSLAAEQSVAAGRQQTTGVEQVSLSIRSINQAMMQNLTSTRQAEHIAQNLNDLARTLKETVVQYKA